MRLKHLPWSKWANKSKHIYIAYGFHRGVVSYLWRKSYYVYTQKNSKINLTLVQLLTYLEILANKKIRDIISIC